MSPSTARAFGNGLMTLAVLWFVMTGACSLWLSAQSDGLDGFPTAFFTVLIFSPITFGPPFVAYRLARRMLRRAARVPKPGAGKRSDPVRIGCGAVLGALGLAWAFFMLSALQAISAHGFSVTQLIPVHMVLVGVLAIVAGAWLVVTGLGSRSGGDRG